MGGEDTAMSGNVRRWGAPSVFRMNRQIQWERVTAPSDLIPDS